MPAPSNTTPATAAAITVLPFTVLLNVTDAPESLTDVPSCVSRAWNAVWYKYTPPIGVNFIYVNANVGAGSNAGYFPSCSVWTGTPGAMTQFSITTPGGTLDYCAQLDGGYYFRLPVTAGTTYYFQVVHDAVATGPTPSIVEFNLKKPSRVLMPAGSLAVNDDTDQYPMAVFGAASGTYLGFPNFPAGEQTDVQPTGEICTQGSESANSVKFLTAQLTVVSTYSLGVESVVAIKADRSGNFYVISVGAGTLTARKFDAIGTLLSTVNVNPAFGSGGVWAVSRDGVRMYRGSLGFNQPLHVYNLQTNSAEADLVAADPAESFAGPGDGYADANGDLVFMRTDLTTNVKVKRYNKTTGAVLNTYTPTSATFGQRFCWADDTPGSFVVWGYIRPNLNNHAVFERIKLSDGSSLSNITGVSVTGNSSQSTEPNQPDCISNSCPVFVLQAAIAPPVFTEEQKQRRLRRFPLPTDRSLTLYLSRFELLIQSGEGLLPVQQGDDPILRVRFSGDGARTWGNWVDISAGEIGDFDIRPVINQVGRLRRGVCEVWVSDPIFWYLLDCFIDGDFAGT